MGRKKLTEKQKKVHNSFTLSYELQQKMDKYLEENELQKSHFIEELIRNRFSLEDWNETNKENYKNFYD